jgi:hypothetical protein
VFPLDRAYWRPGWIEAEPAAFRAWVIDGNDTGTIAPRFARADTVG